METTMEIKTTYAETPLKQYAYLGDKFKKNRLSEIISKHSEIEVKDSFKEILKRNNRSVEAVQIAEILPDASPKRLKRIVKRIPSPKSSTEFSEEEAIALILELGLS